ASEHDDLTADGRGGDAAAGLAHVRQALPATLLWQVALGDLEVSLPRGTAREHVEGAVRDGSREMLACHRQVRPARPAPPLEVVYLECLQRALGGIGSAGRVELPA